MQLAPLHTVTTSCGCLGVGFRWARCPEGWTKFNFGCYFLSTYRMNWDEGQKNCSAQGGSLVVINNKDVQVGVTTLLIFDAVMFSVAKNSVLTLFCKCRRLQDFLTTELILSAYWIGLRKKMDTWSWVDNSTLQERSVVDLKDSLIGLIGCGQPWPSG